MKRPGPECRSRVFHLVGATLLALATLSGCGDADAPSPSTDQCEIANDYLWYAASIGGQYPGEAPESAEEFETVLAGLRGSLATLETVLPEDLQDERVAQVDGWERLDTAFAKYDYDLAAASQKVLQLYERESRQIGEAGASLVAWARDEACGDEAPEVFPTKPADAP